MPRIVRPSAELLGPRTGRYLFVSSISVYADLSRPGVNENGPVARLERETKDYRSEAYGPLKALCEQTIRQLCGDRATIVRPGLIVGPWDPTGRFTYWPVRIADGGEVLAPEPRAGAVQVIDVRDLAEWLLRLDEPGTFNAVGPERPLTMEQLLETCRRVSGSDASLVWAPSEWLVAQGVGEWMELPLAFVARVRGSFDRRRLARRHGRAALPAARGHGRRYALVGAQRRRALPPAGGARPRSRAGIARRPLALRCSEDRRRCGPGA